MHKIANAILPYTYITPRVEMVGFLGFSVYASDVDFFEGPSRIYTIPRALSITG